MRNSGGIITFVSRRILGLLGLGVLAGAILLAVPMLRFACDEVTGAEVLTISARRLSTGEAKRYCYSDHAGRKIRFVLARGADGKLRSIFDACRQCASYKKGFAITHGAVVCRLCGNRYPIEHMLKGEASCV